MHDIIKMMLTWRNFAESKDAESLMAMNPHGTAHKEKEHSKEVTYDLSKETAEKWVSEMLKPEGGKGGKWTYQNVSDLLKAKGSNLPVVDMYVAMNMMYSDYGSTLSKYVSATPDLYFDLAKDWVTDKDISAGDKKTAVYYHCIVK